MKAIVKTLGLLLCLLISGNSLSAQTKNKKPSREELTRRQALYLAQELELDKALGEKLLDTYSQHQQELWALAPERSKPENELKSDQEVGAELQAAQERQQRLLDLKKKYYKRYSEFLSQKQIRKLYQLERKMQQRLQKDWTKRYYKKRNK